MVEEKKLTETQLKVKSILNNLSKWFGFKKKEIIRIRVIAGTNRFWVSNPEKIRYWKSRAENCAKVGLVANTLPAVKITKVIYKS